MSFIEEQEEKSKGWLKSILLISGGILVFVFAKGLGGFVGHQFGSGYREASADAQIERGLEKITNELRGQLPLKLDEVTTVVGVAHLGKQVRYILTIDGELDPETIDEIRTQVTESNREKVCSEGSSNELFEHGIEMVWQYTDSAGQHFESRIRHC